MKRLISVFLALVCMLLFCSTVISAVDFEPSNLTVIMEYGDVTLNGINIAVCRVADAAEENDGVVFNAVSAFIGAEADFTDLTTERNIALAAALDAYASANSIARSSKVTDSSGKAMFKDLPAGLYLVAQIDGVNSEYIIDPYLVAVPAPGETAWNYDVVSYPKTEPVKNPQPISVSVYKIWVGTGSFPSSVSMQLYRNGAAYGNSVTLNAGNTWSYTWDSLDSGDTWTVDELNVPTGYTKSISGNVTNGFIITNTKTTQPPYEGPTTGDTSSMTVWLFLIIASSIGLVTVIRVFHSKRISRLFKKK